MMSHWVLYLSASLCLIFNLVASSPLPKTDEKGGNDSNDGQHWVGIWTAMPQLVEPANLPPTPFNGLDSVFYNTTIRQTVQVGLDSAKIRLRLSNAFGVNNLNISSVAVSHTMENEAGVSTIQPGSTKEVRFSEQSSISIPSAGLAVSDPIEFSVQAQSILLIDIFLEKGQDGFAITGHPGSRTTSFISFDDHVGEKDLKTNGDAVQSIEHWYFISAVEGFLNSETRSFAIVGDSITDGRGSTTNKNNRWPDLVQKKINQDEKIPKIGILNQAAGGNRILHDGLGPNAVSRIDRDVLAQSGVQFAMIFEGVNDIGVAESDPKSQAEIGDQIIIALRQIATRVRTAGISFGAATISPFGTPPDSNYTQPYSSVEREVTRQRVNNFIRNDGVFDFVLDFDRVLRDPQDQSVLLNEFDSGDHLHPNVAGYQAIADYFPLDLFL
ncbi:hypothetical protein PENSTE_c016G06068 [Penicillium steckii]|uniref:Uncharacterized protein n=1 Tax=Penicillium steckii TaxID=303698 RepID=A0A1V6SZH6_9EURO|nr:hypothetical protein PENSTE_c016G06068 [Penicillium steckii]